MADIGGMSHLEQLSLQLTEADLLQSMFPKPGEFHIDDPSVLADIRDYVEEKTADIPGRLDYFVNIHFDKDIKFEVSCSLPYDYPSSEPEVYVRSDQLTRDQKHKINEDVTQYVSSLERGEICVASVVQWVQENGDTYITSPTNSQSPVKESSNIDNEKSVSFSRFWIYSHHIYNKMKRRVILDLARELQLSGFCLPGKPGIICVEGLNVTCEDFWARVKHMNWKKIMCKKKEVVDIVDQKEIKSLRFFPAFEEISFEGRRGPGRDFHMDMGKFYKYLEEHNCGYAFKDYFGVDGKKT